MKSPEGRQDIMGVWRMRSRLNKWYSYPGTQTGVWTVWVPGYEYHLFSLLRFFIIQRE
jgi:hypothetical protein